MEGIGRTEERFESGATPTKLWNRDFSLVVIGQVVSIFGNMVLSFALPLYILDISESPALFGLVLGLPFVSLLVMSPIGGIMADRLRKQRVMFWLDLTTTVIIVLYMATRGMFASAVPIVIVKLMALNAIQGMYMPAVQASVPVLVPPDKLIPANSAVSVVNMLANMVAPAVAGILFGRFGLTPILLISAICFGVTAIMDLLIRIPFRKQDGPGSVAQMVMDDMSLSFRFIVRERPILAKSAGIMFFVNLSLVSLLFVGLPVLITQHLGMSMAMVGINQSVMMVGGLLGGIAAGALGTRLTMRKLHLPLMAISLFLLPMGLVFMFDAPAFVIYVIITAMSALVFVAAQMCSIPMIAFIQRETPTELIGKVMSIMLVLPFLANAMGILLFGMLFERLAGLPWVIVLAVVLVSAAIAVYGRRLFRNVV